MQSTVPGWFFSIPVDRGAKPRLFACLLAYCCRIVLCTCEDVQVLAPGDIMGAMLAWAPLPSSCMRLVEPLSGGQSWPRR